jgi:hypothetical protein
LHGLQKTEINKYLGVENIVRENFAGSISRRKYVSNLSAKIKALIKNFVGYKKHLSLCSKTLEIDGKFGSYFFFFQRVKETN